MATDNGNRPDRIWAWDQGERRRGWYDVRWGKRVAEEHRVEYVRADLHATIEAQLAGAQKEIIDARVQYNIAAMFADASKEKIAALEARVWKLEGLLWEVRGMMRADPDNLTKVEADLLNEIESALTPKPTAGGDVE